eukprot:CAMPEP_0117449732 /NCGR_PEP_ID=MMETSP0759-20121206/8096_1 /TAXON_ID=63605 /ORGANISM="Percolomonas cosmopolitus, Strain WS" /LENGTH=1039 /DNA_ID=CAMNT_0005242215 /DNA_START=153 /DNA_END=3268 /DNA_ORIENTATION=-
MTSISIPANNASSTSTASSKKSSSGKPPSRLLARLAQKSSSSNATTDPNAPPPKPFLKRNTRWGRVLGKMSKAGEPMPKPTRKHTKRAVLERAGSGGDSLLGRGEASAMNRNGAVSSNRAMGQHQTAHKNDVTFEVYAKPRPEGLGKSHHEKEESLSKSAGRNVNLTATMGGRAQQRSVSQRRHRQQHQQSSDDNEEYDDDEPAYSEEDNDIASLSSGQSSLSPSPRNTNILSPTNASQSSMHSVSLSDSIKREDTFYTNADNIKEMARHRDEESFEAHDARKGIHDEDDHSTEDNLSDDMFSPHEPHHDFKHDEDDDDVNLSSSNEAFNRTQKLERGQFGATRRASRAPQKKKSKRKHRGHEEDVIATSGKKRRGDSSKQQRQKSGTSDFTHLDSSAFLYEPTPITLSKEKFSFDSLGVSSSNNPFDDASMPPSSASSQSTNPFVDEPDLDANQSMSSNSEGAAGATQSPHRQEAQPRNTASPSFTSSAHPKSNRMLDIHSSTDSWGPLEPPTTAQSHFPGGSTQHMFHRDGAPADSSRAVPQPQHQPRKPERPSMPVDESQAHSDSAHSSDIDTPVSHEEDLVDKPKISNLVQQYFHTDEKNQKKKEKQQSKMSRKKVEQDTQRELRELREQMEFFKTENDKLRKSRDALLNEKQKFANEKIQFQNDLERRQQEVEEWREEELKKIRKERRVLERQVRANAQHMSRREQEKEIKSLREQLKTASRHNKQHASKLKSEVDRLREKLQAAEEERDAFRESVRRMEMAKIDRQFEEKKKAKVVGPSEAQATALSQRGNFIEDEGHGARAAHAGHHTVSHQVPSRVHKSPGPSKRRSYAAHHGDASRHAERPSAGGAHGPFFDEVQQHGQQHEELHQHQTGNTSASPQHHLPQQHATEPQLSTEHREYRAYVQKLRQQFVVNDSEQRPSDVATSTEPIQVNRLKGGKTENIYRGNVREITYQNGTVIRMFPNGYQKVIFTNGDVKETFPSGKIVYYYYTADTTHTEYPNKMQVFSFPNGQVERHYPDPEGTKEIQFPDKST